MAKPGDSVIAIDMGGTSLKWDLIGIDELSNGPREHKVQMVPLDSAGPAACILETLAQTIEAAFQAAREGHHAVIGIGISTPGPFDLKAGVPLMEHKYRSIHGINIRGEIRRRVALSEELPIVFEYDMDAFLIGEAYHGAARGYGRVIGITLGSGFGSAFMVEGRIVRSGCGVPADGAIWRMPLDGGIVDDKLSHRGIVSTYCTLRGGTAVPGDLDVKSIAELARAGDSTALRVFAEFGSVLGQVLMPIAREFRAECLVFGGQISKSFSLFIPTLHRELEAVGSLRKVCCAEMPDLAPLYGVAMSVARETNNFREMKDYHEEINDGNGHNNEDWHSDEAGW